MYKIDVQKFKKLFPSCAESDKFCNLLDNLLPAAGINTKERVNMFLAQCGHESAGFSRFTEGLNYSAKGLRATFPKYFPDDATAVKYARQKEKIANKVYANRMGNSPESSGDGWKYRGRGMIMITGKDNYIAFSKDMNIDAVNNPDLLAIDLSVAIKSAIWFWNKNNLNRYADAKDILGATKKINGGTNGLEDRKKHYNELMA
jgi:putative chitinase